MALPNTAINLDVEKDLKQILKNIIRGSLSQNKQVIKPKFGQSMFLYNPPQQQPFPARALSNFNDHTCTSDVTFLWLGQQANSTWNLESLKWPLAPFRVINATFQHSFMQLPSPLKTGSWRYEALTSFEDVLKL